MVEKNKLFIATVVYIFFVMKDFGTKHRENCSNNLQIYHLDVKISQTLAAECYSQGSRISSGFGIPRVKSCNDERRN